jgi:hypothetical protein
MIGSLRLIVLGVAAALVIGVPQAYAATSQETMMQDDLAVFGPDTDAVLTQMRTLGVDRLRIAVRWMLIAPDPGSHKRPHGFNASDPAAYPVANWTGLDRVVTEATKLHLDINFNVVGGAPLWATGGGAPRDGKPHYNWAPKGKEFGSFVRALATRYGGTYNPTTNRQSPGDSGDLPAVHFWSIWNEPDYGPSLAPQGDPKHAGHSSIERSPWNYRNLVDGAWTALQQQAGHRHDTFLIGEVAPRGGPPNKLGLFNGMTPLQFVRALYCVDTHYHPLRGTAAAVRGCPKNAASSRLFRRQHPGLFSASGFADHPYSRWYPPNVEAQPSPEWTALAQIGNLTRALDRVTAAYRAHPHFPIWNTEYGYITSPPKRPTKRLPYIGPSKAAYYLNWAEYISWKNPRIRSYMQYLLRDALPALKTNDYGGFASGLENYARKPKRTYDAFRLPLYLPVTKIRRGRQAEVWGCARPAHSAMIDAPADPETVQIQFRPASGGSFTTLRTVTITDPHGYFDTHMSFPKSGTVRVSWTYPADDPLLLPGQTVHSRYQNITVR